MFEPVILVRSPWSIFDEQESLCDGAGQSLAGDKAAVGREGRSSWPRGTVYPPMNVWSSADGLVIDAEIPGIDPKDVEIAVKGDELTLSGKLNAAGPGEGEACYRRERASGEFVRRLQLPLRAETGAVKASAKNGVLRLTIPQSEEEKPRKIAIEAA
ncbi:MAG: Hsp20/alpha crystallin family protein [bacterium]